MPPLTLVKTITDGALPQPNWSGDALCVTFQLDRHTGPARALLNRAYATGHGECLGQEEWWSKISDDVEFDPALCFPVENRLSGKLIAFAHCWTTGFIKDIAVATPQRRTGLGTALMAQIFQTFRTRGLPSVSLKVEAENQNAIAFYRSLCMTDTDLPSPT